MLSRSALCEIEKDTGRGVVVTVGSRVRRLFTFVFLTTFLISGLVCFPLRSYANPDSSSQVAVLVDSGEARDNYYYFQIGVEKWLKWWKIDYSLIDLASTELTQTLLSNYSVILVGQYGAGSRLSASEISEIENAVSGGVGIVQLDPRNYDSSFLGVFGVQPIAWIQSAHKLNFTINDNNHFITSIYENNSVISARLVDWDSGPLESPVNFEYVSITTGRVLVTLKYQGQDHPAIVCNNYGSGKTVFATFATGSTPLYFGDVNGFGEKPSKTSSDIHGLLLRSLVWASREPFVFLGLPPFVSFRVDDATESIGGNQHYLENIVNNGMFVDFNYMVNSLYASPEWQNRLRNLYLNNQIRIAPHALSQMNPIYYDHLNNREYPYATLASYFADIDGNLTQWGITSSSLIAPHFYKIGANAVPFLLQREWASADMKYAVPPSDALQDTWMYSENFYQCPLVFDYADANKTIRALDFASPALITVDEEGNQYAQYDFLTGISNPANVTAIIERLLFIYEHGLSAMYPGEAFTHEAECVGISEAQWNTAWTAVFSEIKNRYPFVIPTSMETVSYYLQERENVDVANYSFDGSQVVVDFSGKASSSVAFYLFTGGKKIVSYMDILDRILPCGEGGYLLWLPTFSNGHSVSLTLGDDENTIPQVRSSNANITNTSYDGILSISAGPIWKHTEPKYTFEIDCKNLGAPSQVTVNGEDTQFNYTNNAVEFQANLPASSQIVVSWSWGPPPVYSNVGYNTTLVKSLCQFHSLWRDNSGLSGYIFGTNLTGIWVNDTFSTLNGQRSWANKTKTLVNTPGVRVRFQWWCNDSQNKWSTTGSRYLVTTAGQPPAYSNIGYNSTLAGKVTLFHCYWQDAVGLSGFIFSWNENGTWTNDPWTPINGLSAWSNVTKTLPSTVGTVIGFRWNCSDTDYNWNTTPIQTLTTTAPGQSAFLGKTTIGATENTAPPGYVTACRFQAPAEGTITRISAHIKGKYESGLAKAMIFSDVSGEVGTLLFESSQIILLSSWTWHNFSASYDIQSGSYYWFAVFTSVELQITYDTGQTYQSADAWGWTYPIVLTDFNGAYGPSYYDAIMDIYATYEQNSYSLTVSAVGNGSVTKVPERATYTYGTSVELTAVPAPGWSFAGWSGDLTGINNPATITMNGNRAVIATFTQDQYTLVVTTFGSGSVSKVPNQATYIWGTNATLTATADIGWSFSSWGGDVIGTANPTTINMTGNRAVTATFTQNQYTLTINTAGLGLVSKMPDQATYVYGTSVELTATSDPSWSFSQWTGDLTGSANPTTITITGNMVITATFTEDEYTLTVSISPVEGGSVAKNPDELTYHYNDVIELTATAAAGYSFTGWSGGLTGNPTYVTITADTAVTAYFTPIEYTLDIIVVGSGSVSKNPDNPTYHLNDIVQLTAVPSAGWSFNGWSDDVSGSTNPASITMDGDKSVTATFTQDHYALTVTTVGSGSVSKNPNQATYVYGDTVILTANPAAGWSFSSWSGALSGPMNPTNLTITGNLTVTAIFTQNTYTLTINVVGSGSVNLDNIGPYHYGDVVQLTAVPTIGWSFSVWSGDLSGSSNPTTILIDGNKAVTVTFIQNAYTLTVDTVGSGSVTKVPEQASYNYGDIVQLTATPASGWSFSAWSGDASGSINPVSITIDGNKVVTATFIQNEYTLTISIVGSGTVSKIPDQATYTYGSSVQLAASPEAGWAFSYWSGDLSSSENPATIIVTGNMAITAHFSQNQYTLTINVIGSGSVIKNPDQATYARGSTVELTADPDIGWSFSGWSGDATGSDNPITITMDGNKAVTATFTQNQYTLTINIVGQGSVSKEPDQETYFHGATVQLTATPQVGWSFSYWNGDLSGSTNPETITMTDNMTVTATFTQNVYTLTVTTLGSGSVSLNNSGPHHYGDIVQMTAIPATGWSFESWSGDLVGSINPTTLAIDGNKAVTATFTQDQYTWTVTTSGSGSVSKIPNQVTYIWGTNVTLTATADIGWSFASWSGDAVGTANPITINMTDNKAVTVTFIQNVYTLTVTVAGSGYVNRNNTGPYHYGDVVSLTAVANAGWSFNHWEGDLSGTANPTTILINDNKDVTATFTQDTYTLTITTIGSGYVNLNNSGPYHYDDVVQLTAVPEVGWSFSHWNGDLSGSSNPTTILIDSNKEVTATFTQEQYTLAISTVGSGSVNKSPNQETYAYGTSVQLTASPSLGWSFAGWSGDLYGSANPATIIMDGSKSVTATFTQNQYTLSVTIVGSGTVTKNPDQLTYAYGTIVSLTAGPSVGWSFNGWSGDATGFDNPTTITMDGNKAVTATFTQNQYTLTINIVGSGSVSKNPDQLTYHLGDAVELTATPNAGWSFSGWSGDLSGLTNPASVTIDVDPAVTATFTQNVYTLTVTAVGSGAVDLNNTGPYYYGDVVELTAVPATGWSFDHWSGDLTGSANPTTILIDEDKAVRATFTQNTYTLAISTLGSGSVNLNNSGPYHYGDVVELTANPAAGWSFDHWNGDLSGSLNPTTILIDSDKAIMATFTQNVYILTVSTVGDGVVNLNNTGPYYYGYVIELTAVPSIGWSFDHWSDDLTGTINPAAIIMNSDKAVTATFTQNVYSITASVTGVGGTIDPSGVILVAAGSNQLFTIEADPGYVIADVLVDSVSQGAISECTFYAVTMNHSITASFTQGVYTITASVDGVGGTINPSGAVPVNGGETITFTINPDNGYHILNVMVDGTYMGPQSSYIFYEVDRNHTITAIFTQNEHTLTIIIVGAGSVSINPNKISYSYGDIVSLTAIPNNKNWQFAYWSGDLTGNTNPATIIMNSSKTITATFTRKPKS